MVMACDKCDSFRVRKFGTSEPLPPPCRIHLASDEREIPTHGQRYLVSGRVPQEMSTDCQDSAPPAGPAVERDPVDSCGKV